MAHFPCRLGSAIGGLHEDVEQYIDEIKEPKQSYAAFVRMCIHKYIESRRPVKITERKEKGSIITEVEGLE